MGEDQRLTQLIAGIYDAALDSSQWSDVLGGIADFVGGQGGGLLAKDTLKKSVHAHCYANVDPRFMQLYADTYGRCGPVATSLFGEVGCVASIPELMPYNEFCRGCFYREWAKPQGWVDIAIAVLEVVDRLRVSQYRAR